MNSELSVQALVVYESFFGNTESIARAVASGLRLEGLAAETMDAADAQEVDLDRYALLVVGAPTHAFSLSRPSSRADAVARGGDSRYRARGLREWLSDLPIRDGTHLAAAFDTRVRKVRRLPMSAARSAAHILRKRHLTLVTRPMGFIVQDVEGPLEPRELLRAITWARSVAGETQARIAIGQERKHTRSS